MALPVDHNAPDASPEAATDLWGADGAGAAISQAGANPAGANPAGIVVAAAGDELKADLTVLGLDDLLNLPVDQNVPAEQPDGLAQLAEIADLPADLTALDLDQVLGLELAGATLPTVLEIAALPADLTALELAQVLGLELDGATLPTLQEVVQLALQKFNNSDNKADNSNSNSSNSSKGDADVPVSTDIPDVADDFSFVDVQSLTDHALSNSAQFASAASQGHANGKALGVDFTYPGARGGVRDDFDSDNAGYRGNGSSALVDEGGGINVINVINVINGTVGNDVLKGTPGADIINGLGGADTLRGQAGADILDGGTGTDTATYQGSGAVAVNLATGTGSGGDAQGDILVNIENLIGSSQGDILTGDANANIIDGASGNDTLDGGAGVDSLSGGNGNDTLVWDVSDASIDGGGQTDTLRVDAGDADITTFGGTISGIENVDLATDTGANALTLTATDVLVVTDNADTLTIDGDALDSVDAGGGWTDGGVAGAYHIYTQGTATLNVDTDITVNANILV